MIRKNITIQSDLADYVNAYAAQRGETFCAVVRKVLTSWRRSREARRVNS